MSKRSDRNIAAARKVEDALRAEGRHFEADAVSRLRRSLSAAVTTLEVLHRDNMDLRRRLDVLLRLDDGAEEQERAEG